MFRSVPALLVVGTAACSLAACGSDSNPSSSAAQAQLSRINAAVKSAPAAGASTSSSAPSGPKVDPTTIDACALLTQDDANSAARSAQFDDTQDASTVYRLTTTKDPAAAASSGCTILLKETGGDAQGTATFQVTAAGDFSHYSITGTKINGLGDEAYDGGDSPVVRVGSLKITPSEDSFPDALTVALLRKMAPKLKQKLGG